MPVTFVSDPPTKALPEILLEQYPPPDTVVNDRLGDVPGNDESANLIHQIADTLLSPKHSLTIVSPYFVPSGEWAQRFVELAQRGITLNILTNSLTANDVLAVHAGYMRYRTTLLQGNVNLFELKSKRSLRHTALGMGSGSSLGSQFGSNLSATVDESTGSDKPVSTKSIPLRPMSHRRHKRPSRHYRRQHRDRHRWINRSTASLHAKTFSVDGEKLFIGSFNFDPRSAALNTEMGAIIHSPTLARELDDMIDRWKNELSYVVSINDDKLQWVDNSANPAAVFQDEPDSRFHQRLLVWLLGRLPIEDFL